MMNQDTMIDKFLDKAKKAEDRNLLEDLVEDDMILEIFAGALAETYHERKPFNSEIEFANWVNNHLAASLIAAFHEGL